MRRKLFVSLLICALSIGTQILVFYPDAYAQEAKPLSRRLSGQDLYQTAKVISEEFNGEKCSTVILASGRDFPDALSSSVLSKKLNAPIILADVTSSDSSEAINYINSHVPQNGTIYIIGGTSVIGTDVETTLRDAGYQYIIRLAGQDRYDTDMAVVNEVNVSRGTPVFIVSGENFPDALSVSSFAGSKQYPTLLVEHNTLPEKTSTYLANNAPSTVYIAGGTGVVSQEVENQIQTAVPNATIKRLAGNDRFDTTGTVAHEFAPTPKAIYLANGFNFPDALAGSALAAKTGDPILLVDHNTTSLHPTTVSYLETLHNTGIRPVVRAIGGTVVVPDILIQQAENVLDGKPPIVADSTTNPENWICPQMTATTTGDTLKDMELIHQQLGFFHQPGNSSAHFFIYGDNSVKVPFGNGIDVAELSDMSNVEVEVTLYEWGARDGIPGSAKVIPLTSELMKFYCPTEYSKITPMIGEFFNQNGGNDGKIFRFDGREIKFKDSSTVLKVVIGKVGQAL